MCSKFVGLFIIAIFFVSCNKKGDKILFQNKIYELDVFNRYSFNKKIIDTVFINVTNDTIYVYQDFVCEDSRIIGCLKHEGYKTLSLSNECGTTTIVTHVTSILEKVDILEKENIFNFKLTIGDNNYGYNDVIKKFKYSRSKGLISLEEKDTIIVFPWLQ